MGDGYIGRAVRRWLCIVVIFIFIFTAVADSCAVACSHVDGPGDGAACNGDAVCNGGTVCNTGAGGYGYAGGNASRAHGNAAMGRR